MPTSEQILSFEIRNSVKNEDWKSVERLCSENEITLSENEMNHWVRSRYMIGDFEGCIEICSRILETNEKNTIALKFIARSRTKLRQNNTEIRNSWNNLLVEDNSNIEAMTNIARILVIEGSLEEASKLISDILELNPNYQPALTTLAKLNRLGMEGTSPPIEDSDYRQIYTEKRYLDVLENLNYPDRLGKWSEDEATFAFRSLSRLGKNQDLLSSYQKLDRGPQLSPRIISELASSARELGEEKVENDSIRKLSKIASDNYSAGCHYLRQIVYFDSDDEFVIKEIERISSLHGEEILQYLVRIILKSKRFSLFSKIRSFGGAKSFLDPIDGKLLNMVGKNEYQSIFAELSPRISQAIKSDISSFHHSVDSFHRACDELDLPYLVSATHLMEKSDLFEEKMQISSFSREYLEDLCNQIFIFPEEVKISSKPGSVVFCSTNKNPDFHNLGEDIEIISVSLEKIPKGLVISKMRGMETRKESEIISDPRETLGRFFHLFNGMASVDKMVIAWVVRELLDRGPEFVFYDESMGHGKIAAKILGYDAESIRKYID